MSLFHTLQKYGFGVPTFLYDVTLFSLFSVAKATLQLQMSVCLFVPSSVCLLSKPPAFIFHPSSFILTFATFKLFSLFLKASLLGKLSKFICKKHGIFHMLDFDPCLRNHTLIFFCDTL